MKTINSLSGGKTSSYVAAHYPADYDVFALVRIEDEDSKFPDKKIRQIVEDKIQAPFIATAEQDAIIYTMLDLEQHIGREITWVTGKTFDQIIKRPEGKKYLPNKMMRFCTIEMKLEPIKQWWWDNIREPVEQRIGFRASEMKRAKSMLERCEDDGFMYEKFVTGKRKTQNKWTTFKYQKPVFPLIEDGIFKDRVEHYWSDKSVRFAYMNNCVGCFHRSAMLLKKMSNLEPNKMEWFAKQERDLGYTGTNGGFKNGMTYDEIISWNLQYELFDEDFNECDSGYCGL